MNPALVGALAQLTAVAVSTLLEYLRQPPADDASAAAADAAAMALMTQQQRIADALRVRLGVPDSGDREQMSDVREAGLAAPAASDIQRQARRPRLKTAVPHRWSWTCGSSGNRAL